MEGMKPQILLEALERAGATFLDEAPGKAAPGGPPITKADLFSMGLTGGSGSAARRQALLKRLELPEHLTTGSMLEALNLLYDRESLCRLLEKEQI